MLYSNLDLAPGMDKLGGHRSIQLEELSDLINQAAHDIRSPLSALKMMLKLDSTLPAERKLIIERCVERINAIAEDILFQFDGNKPLEIFQKNFEFRSALREALNEKIFQIHKTVTLKAINIDCSDPSSIYINFDKNQFMRIISNILNNSLDATDDNEAEIAVTLLDQSDLGFIQVIIEDNGKGIPKAKMNSLGQKGFSAGKERDNILDRGPRAGFGLGLYGVRKALEKEGGTFEIQSEEGVGTKVILGFKRIPTSLKVALD